MKSSADCGLRLADCGLRLADCGLRLADCGLRLDLSVSGCSIFVRYLDSWYVGEPQKETIGRIGKPGLCSFGRP